MSKTATAKKAATSKAAFHTIEAIRACTADQLSERRDVTRARKAMEKAKTRVQMGSQTVEVQPWH
jgi:hypothetical protein